MSDTIIKATAAKGQIRAYAANTQNLCEYAHKIHNTSPVVTVALGRLLTAAGMMGSMMKNDDEVLTLLFRGDGPLQGMTVTTNNKAEVKGYAYNNEVKSDNPLKTGPALGEGNLSIIKDIGLKEPYVGNSPLISGEIAEDLTYYYAISEQTPTSVALGVTLKEDNTVSAAGGFIIQLMPFCDDDIIDQLEEKLSKAPAVTTLLAENPDPAALLETLLGDFELKINDTMPTNFICDCSKNKVTKALISVGEKDLTEMINDGKTIEVNCDFCGTHYNFEPAELEVILEKAMNN